MHRYTTHPTTLKHTRTSTHTHTYTHCRTQKDRQTNTERGKTKQQDEWVRAAYGCKTFSCCRSSVSAIRVTERLLSWLPSLCSSVLRNGADLLPSRHLPPPPAHLLSPPPPCFSLYSFSPICFPCIFRPPGLSSPLFISFFSSAAYSSLIHAH